MASLPPYPRKRLGQHFLIDPNLQQKIMSLADLQPSEAVCEVGPGGGALTGLLCQAAQHVLALEVDPRMVAFLKTELAGHPNLDVEEQDALKYPFNQLAPSTVVVANLPYNISTPIMFRLLEARHSISRMVLMVQLEVAQRLAAKPRCKDYGVLSVMVQHLAQVTFGFKVSKKCFRPVPDVDSAVVRLDMYQEDQKQPEDFSQFQWTVRAAFAQRRKTLMNAFRAAGVSDVWLQRVEPDTGISLTRRAETLSVQEFQSLARMLPVVN